jgi:hypothetical protein
MFILILIILFGRQNIGEGKCLSNFKIHNEMKCNSIASIAIVSVADVVLLQEKESDALKVPVA